MLATQNEHTDGKSPPKTSGLLSSTTTSVLLHSKKKDATHSNADLQCSHTHTSDFLCSCTRSRLCREGVSHCYLQLLAIPNTTNLWTKYPVCTPKFAQYLNVNRAGYRDVVPTLTERSGLHRPSLTAPSQPHASASPVNSLKA